MIRVKESIAILSCLLMVLSGLMAVFGNVSAQTSVSENLEYLDDAINARDKGLSWLRSSQLEDGAWSYDLGITSLCVLAFLNAGYDETDPTVSKAINYILQYVQPDGSISSGTYANYYTSVALLALSATHNSEYETIIRSATQFIIDIQIDENTPDDAYRVNKNDWRYGGIGYGGDGRPDLSNTQFSLMALHAAENSVDDLVIPAEVWTNALVFIGRCHNNAEFNDQAWASNTTRPSYNDGGYIYFPTDQGSLAGGTDSYMSMTGAAIWSTILCGLRPTDERVISALNWFTERYTWEENVGFGQKALYYSYWTMARGLVIAQKKDIVVNEVANNWFSDLTEKLVALQTEEGYWVNTESDWFWEDVPDIATSYAILALETNVLSSASKVTVDLRPSNDDAVDVKVYDSNGAEVGEKTSNGESQTIVISEAQADTLTIEVVGKDGKKSTDYTMDVVGSYSDREVAKKTYNGNIDDGEYHEVVLVVTAVEGPISFYGDDEPTTTVEADPNEPVDNVTFFIAIVAIVAVIVILIFLIRIRIRNRD